MRCGAEGSKSQPWTGDAQMRTTTVVGAVPLPLSSSVPVDAGTLGLWAFGRLGVWAFGGSPPQYLRNSCWLRSTLPKFSRLSVNFGSYANKVPYGYNLTLRRLYCSTQTLSANPLHAGICNALSSMPSVSDLSLDRPVVGEYCKPRFALEQASSTIIITFAAIDAGPWRKSSTEISEVGIFRLPSIDGSTRKNLYRPIYLQALRQHYTVHTSCIQVRGREPGKGSREPYSGREPTSTFFDSEDVESAIN